MNKKLLKSTLMVAMVAVAGYGSYKAYEGYAMNEKNTLGLLAENIEAMSTPDEPGQSTTCKIGNYDCKVEMSQAAWKLYLESLPEEKKAEFEGRYNGFKVDLSDLTVKCEYGKGSQMCCPEIKCNDVYVQLGILDQKK